MRRPGILTNLNSLLTSFMAKFVTAEFPMSNKAIEKLQLALKHGEDSAIHPLLNLLNGELNALTPTIRAIRMF